MKQFARYLVAFTGLAFANAAALVEARGQEAPAVVAAAAPAPARTPGWANSRSDLPPDRDYTLGMLPNGMRYLILPNQNPPGQVAMRMVISVGSMHEATGQEGLAHFLEHLAFRGSKQLPDGEIQRRLEALGLQMGSDVNATTHADHTTFMLDMARNDAGSLDTGLTILREIASELELAPGMIDAERGVVLAEERMRASPEETEAAMASLRLQVGDHPFAREVVGKRDVIQTADQRQIRKFYDAFYRPERATLVIVGDLRPGDIVPILQQRFSDWAGRGPAGADPAPVMNKPDGPDVAVFMTNASPSSSIELYWFEPYRELPPTRAERRRVLVEQLGQGAVAQRMRGLNEAAGRPARNAGSPAASRISGVWNGQFARAVDVSDPAAAIGLMARAQRQAVEFGITREEFERVKALRLDEARAAVAMGRTADSSREAEAISDRLTSDPVFVSRADSLAMLEEDLKTITLDDVNAAIRDRLKDKPKLVYRGPKRADVSEASLRAALDRAMGASVTAYAAAPVKPWPYETFGAPGKVAERRQVADLGVTYVKFENGVRLTVKPMPIMGDQIFVQARLGLGRLGMPRDRIDASDMGQLVWSSGGLGQLTNTEQGRTLAGKRVGISTTTEEDAFALSSGATLGELLPLQLQLMAARVSDPGFRTDEWNTWMASSAAAEAAAPFSAARVLDFNLQPMLHAGDLRWTYNTTEMRKSWKPADAVAFIKPIVEKSPIEVIMVGGVDVERAILEVGKTFGALPARAEKAEPAGLRSVKFPAPTAKPVVLKHKGRSDQGYAIIAWPTNLGFYTDPRAARAGMVLADMLRDEATRQLRTGNGSTYSPIVIDEFSYELPEYGYIGMQVELPPDKLDGVLAQIEGIAADIANNQIPVSEVARITGPRIEQARREQVAAAGYWIAFLAGTMKDPKKLDPLRSELADYQSLTPADIQAAAKRWLKAETAWKLKVVPE